MNFWGDTIQSITLFHLHVSLYHPSNAAFPKVHFLAPFFSCSLKFLSWNNHLSLHALTSSCNITSYQTWDVNYPTGTPNSTWPKQNGPFPAQYTRVLLPGPRPPAPQTLRIKRLLSSLALSPHPPVTDGCVTSVVWHRHSDPTGTAVILAWTWACLQVHPLEMQVGNAAVDTSRPFQLHLTEVETPTP